MLIGVTRLVSTQQRTATSQLTTGEWWFRGQLERKQETRCWWWFMYASCLTSTVCLARRKRKAKKRTRIRKRRNRRDMRSIHTQTEAVRFENEAQVSLLAAPGRSCSRSERSGSSAERDDGTLSSSSGCTHATKENGKELSYEKHRTAMACK